MASREEEGRFELFWGWGVMAAAEIGCKDGGFLGIGCNRERMT